MMKSCFVEQILAFCPFWSGAKVRNRSRQQIRSYSHSSDVSMASSSDSKGVVVLATDNSQVRFCWRDASFFLYRVAHCNGCEPNADGVLTAVCFERCQFRSEALRNRYGNGPACCRCPHRDLRSHVHSRRLSACTFARLLLLE